MKSQNEVLLLYRQKFPEETLLETSQKTGIQITRVHRLFRGREMRARELESFLSWVEGSDDDHLWRQARLLPGKKLEMIKSIVALEIRRHQLLLAHPTVALLAN